jgi:hypothetical protein
MSMECSALDFPCQCTQQNLQSICAVLTFDSQPKKILIFSVKDRYQFHYFNCIKVNYFFKIKYVFFLYLLLSASWKKNDLTLIYFWYQTDSVVPNTSIFFFFSRFLGVSILQLLIIYRINDYNMLTLSQ